MNMNDSEIRTSILSVCKVASWDSDFNVVGFHALCDKLKEIGAAAERDRFAQECIDLVAQYGGSVQLEAAIRARSES
jgi:hypothetical protein